MKRMTSLAVALWSAGAALAQTEIVVDGPPVWGEGITVVEEVRIGDRTDEEYILGRIAAVAVTENGNIWIADDAVPVIRMYDAEGHYLRDVGSAGAGPGEYNRLMGLKRMPDDSVWLWDPRNRRINVYDASGDFLVSHPVNSGTHSSDAFHVDGQGNAYVMTMDRDGPRQPNGDPAMVLLKVAASGQDAGTMAWPPENQANGFVLLSTSGYRKPFYPEVINAVSAEGVVIRADNMAYTIDVGEDRRLRRPYQRLMLNSKERSQWLETARSFEARSGADYASRIPKEKPAFRNVNVFSDGRIWVDLYTEAEYVEKPRREDGRQPLEWVERRPVFDVIGGDGTYFGQVTLPQDTYLYEARGQYVWAERELEDGSPIVVKLRIETEGS